MYPFEATRLVSLNSCRGKSIDCAARSLLAQIVIAFPTYLRPLMPPVHQIRVFVVNILPDGAEDVVPLGLRAGKFGLLGYEIDGIAKEELEIDEVGDLD